MDRWTKTSGASKDIRLLFIKLAKDTPFIDDMLNTALLHWECRFNHCDHSDSSLAGAAHFEGTLVSLRKSPHFLTETIAIHFGINGNPVQQKEIKNLVEVEHVRKIRRWYVPSPKHQQGGPGTLMDLNNEIAQEVLDKGIPGGKKIYGYYNKKFYEFQPDNAGGYHGYPISDIDVPARTFRKMRDSGLF